jgi:hypothetical protein
LNFWPLGGFDYGPVSLGVINRQGGIQEKRQEMAGCQCPGGATIAITARNYKARRSERGDLCKK